MNYVQEFAGDIKIDGSLAVKIAVNETAISFHNGNYEISKEGIYYFYACKGALTISNANAIVYLVASSALAISNNVNAKTYRDGYGVGDIYQSTNSVSPAVKYGGSWEQLAADAYLKIVTSGAGNLGGTNAQHKIPIESIPSHGYHLPYGGSGTQGGNCNLFLRNDTMITSGTTGRGWNNIGTEMYPAGFNLGGGQPYYPYYYGIYMWVRVA